MSAQNSTSCITKKPFMEIGAENAPHLDYKLPQTNGFNVNSPLLIPLASTDFLNIPNVGLKPVNGYFDLISAAEISMVDLQQQMAVNIGNNFVVNTGDFVSVAESNVPVVYTTGGGFRNSCNIKLWGYNSANKFRNS